MEVEAAAADLVDSLADERLELEGQVELATSTARVIADFVAAEWDNRIEAAAAAGEIQRNPLTGLGLPTPAMMQELNADNDLAYADYRALMSSIAAKEAEEIAAQIEVEAAASDTTAKLGAALHAAKVVQERSDSLTITSVVAGAGVVLMLLIAVSFWLVASRARND